MRNLTVVGVGGFCLITAALGFVGVLAYLTMQFDYPAILDGTAADVLPRLLATGEPGRAIWTLYGFIPLLLVPAGVGAYHALRDGSEGRMVVALLMSVMAALTMMLGVLRWPSIHWELANAYASAAPAERAVIAAVFAGLNSFLGNFLGEFLGEVSLNLFFLLSSVAMLTNPRKFPGWIAYSGSLAAFAGLVGMFRNATALLDPVAVINNYLLPVWMVIFGVSLIRDDIRRANASY